MALVEMLKNGMCGAETRKKDQMENRGQHSKKMISFFKTIRKIPMNITDIKRPEQDLTITMVLLLLGNRSISH